MKTYHYKLSLQAQNEQEADAKIKALTLLAGKLSQKELEKISDVVVNQPLLFAMAKTKLGL